MSACLLNSIDVFGLVAGPDLYTVGLGVEPDLQQQVLYNRCAYLHPVLLQRRVPNLRNS